jgi:hypothetical protein
LNLAQELFAAPTPMFHEKPRKLNPVRGGRKPTGRAWGQLPGEQHARAKLTNAQAREIRGLYAAGIRGYKTLSRRFGVAWPTIRDVVKHRSYTTAGGDTTFADPL